jgi:hypothetical protein
MAQLGMNQIQGYLEGREFSSGLQVRVVPTSPGPAPATDRQAWILALCAGQRVVHLGCCDHVPLIRDKIAAGIWLHGRLTTAASQCLGVDVDADAVRYLRDELGYDNVVCADLSRDAPARLTSGGWDWMVAGEIVEHLDDPVRFLSQLRETAVSHCRGLVVTVPNALRLENGLLALRGIECVNTDHRYWFTPFTIAKVLTRAGFRCESVDFVHSYPPPAPRGIRSWLASRLLRRRPMLRDTLVATALFRPPPA